jgi:ribonuclease Z
MTTVVTVTGTGVPVVAAGRAGPGLLVQCGSTMLQFDAGRATTLRLAEAGVRTSQLSALFVTHHHSDHLTGLTDLLFTRWLEGHGNFTPLPVVVPEGDAAELVGHLLDPWQSDIAVRRKHVGRTDDPAPLVSSFDAAEAVDEALHVWASPDGTIEVLARAVHHEPVLPAVAYRVETPDGVVVVSGDTVVCQEVAELAAGADVLVHEAFRREEMLRHRDLLPHVDHLAAYHADTVELGALAAQVGVPTVVLTHLIPAPGMGAVTEEDYVSDLRRGGYTGNVLVAEDLTSLTI